MSDVLNQAKSEIKQLPFMLGKLVGGIMVVVGVAGLVLIWTGKSGPLLSSLVPYFFSALLGFLLFQLCSRTLARRVKKSPLQTVPARDVLQVNIVAWSLLLLLVIIFLLITYFVTQ
jgi:hypothetical protein